MEVILIEEVYNLGNPGDVVKVKRGYARNYLLPNKLAVNKTPYSLKKINDKREEFAKKIDEKNQEYQDLLSQLNEIKTLEVPMSSSKEGKLFGSLNPLALSNLLQETHKIKLDKKFIIIRDPIKNIGEYLIDVVFKSDIKTRLKVSVIDRKN